MACIPPGGEKDHGMHPTRGEKDHGMHPTRGEKGHGMHRPVQLFRIAPPPPPPGLTSSVNMAETVAEHFGQPDLR